MIPKPVLHVASAVAVIAAFVFPVLLLTKPTSVSASVPAPNAVVQVIAGHKYGSGFHIGGGQFLTAEHVIREEEVISVEVDGHSYAAVLLWEMRDYDVALLQVVDLSHAEALEIDCSPVEAHRSGEILLHGFAGEFGEVQTHGHVLSGYSYPNRRSSSFTIDATILPGQSGGPVISVDSGEVVGLSVAATRSPTNFALAVAVPSETLCQLARLPG